MIIYLTKKIWSGQSLARILMNDALRKYTISGKVLDIGGARSPDYFKYLNVAENTEIISSDMMLPQSKGINFEKDPLPYKNEEIDHVLMFNILEHIFNHQFLMGEAHRVLKNNSKILGFVPFLVNYHPDPHDFFRYTKEALVKILEKAGFKEIEVKEIGRGPFAVNYNNLVFSVPIIVRIILLPIYYFLDSIFIKFRPQIRVRYPLGYIFSAKK